MDTTNFETGVFLFALLFPLFCFVVVLGISVLAVSTAMIYVKAGRPAWLSLVPLYNFVELFDIAGVSVWWTLPVPVLATVALVAASFGTVSTGLLLFPLVHLLGSLAMAGTMLYVYYRLSKQFGESGWYSLGYLVLPIVFLPMLGFGKAKFKGLKRKNIANQKNKLVVTGILAVSVCVMVTACVWFMVKSVMVAVQTSDAAPATHACYQTSRSRVYYVPSRTPLQADMYSFTSMTPEYMTLSGNCYGKDLHTVFFGGVAILGADAATFRVLGRDAFYAADAVRVYRGAKVIEDANPKTFTDLGQGYAKGKNTVFYFSTGMSTDGSDNGDLTIIAGADVATFETVVGEDTFDARDKNRLYQYGIVVSVRTSSN